MMGDNTLTRPVAATLAALLDQGRIVDATSRGLTVAAALSLMLLPALAGRPPIWPMTILSVVMLAGIAEIYLAVRVGFDAALFRQLAADPGGPDLAALDGALVQLELLASIKAGRPLPARIAGSQRLLRRQAVLVIVQACLALAGAVAAAAA
jgi:hypothetical protein